MAVALRRTNVLLMICCLLILGAPCILQGCDGGNGGNLSEDFFVDRNIKCENCFSAHNKYCGQYKCGDRIDWLKNHKGQSHDDATYTVCWEEFKAECGCCQSSGEPTPATPAPSSSNPPGSGSGEAIKVVSYNLFGWKAFATNPSRGENILRKINAWNPTVVGAQEVEHGCSSGGCHGEAEVARKVTSTCGLSEAGGAQFYNEDLLEKHDSARSNLVGGYWISMTKYKQKSTGAYFLYFNSHWKHGHSEEQGRKIVEFVNSQRQKHGPLPAVLVGDSNQFNGQDSVAWKKLSAELFDDVMQDKGSTYHSGGRPDMIFASKGDWTIKQSKVDRDGWGSNGGSASDHAGLMAELALK